MFQQWVGSNSPNLLRSSSSEDQEDTQGNTMSDSAPDPDPDRDLYQDANTEPSQEEESGVGAVAGVGGGYPLSFDLPYIHRLSSPVIVNAPIESPPAAASVVPGYPDRTSPESNLSFQSIHSGRVASSNSRSQSPVALPRTISINSNSQDVSGGLARTISTSSNHGVNVMNHAPAAAAASGSSADQQPSASSASAAPPHPPASGSQEPPVRRDISFENVNLAQEDLLPPAAASVELPTNLVQEGLETILPGMVDLTVADPPAAETGGSSSSSAAAAVAAVGVSGGDMSTASVARPLPFAPMLSADQTEPMPMDDIEQPDGLPDAATSSSTISAPKPRLNAVFDGLPVAGVEIEVTQRDLDTGGGEDAGGEVVWKPGNAQPGEPAPLKDANCCICSGEFVLDERACALECGHVFHSPCLNAWFKRNATCPLCRMPGLATDKIVANRLARLKACVEAGRYNGVIPLVAELSKFARQNQLGDEDTQIEVSGVVAMALENTRDINIARHCSDCLLQLSTKVIPTEYIRRGAFREFAARHIARLESMPAGPPMRMREPMVGNLIGIFWNYCLREPPDQLELVAKILAGPVVRLIRRALSNVTHFMNAPVLILRCVALLFHCVKGPQAAKAIYDPVPWQTKQYQPTNKRELVQVLVKLLLAVQKTTATPDPRMLIEAEQIATVLCVITERAPLPQYSQVFLMISDGLKVQLFTSIIRAYTILVLENKQGIHEGNSNIALCKGMARLLVALTRQKEFVLTLLKMQAVFGKTGESTAGKQPTNLFLKHDAPFWKLIEACKERKLKTLLNLLVGAVWNLMVGIAKIGPKAGKLPDQFAVCAAPVLAGLLPHMNTDDLELETRHRLLTGLMHVCLRKPAQAHFVRNIHLCLLLEKCTRQDFKPAMARQPAAAVLATLFRNHEVAIAICKHNDGEILDHLIGATDKLRSEVVFQLSIPQPCHVIWMATPERVEKLNAVGKTIAEDPKKFDLSVCLDHLGIVWNMSCADADTDENVTLRSQTLGPVWIPAIVNCLNFDHANNAIGMFERGWTALMYLTNQEDNAKAVAAILSKISPLYPLKYMNLIKLSWLVIDKVLKHSSTKEADVFTAVVFGKISEQRNALRDALAVADLRVMSTMKKLAEVVPITLVKSGVFGFSNLEAGGFWFAFDACAGATEQNMLLDVVFTIINGGSSEAKNMLLQRIRPAVQRALAKWAGTPITKRLADLREIVLKYENAQQKPMDAADEQRINARIKEACHSGPERMFECLLDVTDRNIFWWGAMPFLEDRFLSDAYSSKFLDAVINSLRQAIIEKKMVGDRPSPSLPTILSLTKSLTEIPRVQRAWLRRQDWQRELGDLLARLPIWKAGGGDSAEDDRPLIPANWAGREALLAAVIELYMSHPRHGPRQYTADCAHLVLPILETLSQGYYSENAIIVMEEILQQNPVREAVPAVSCITMCAACMHQFPSPPLPASTSTHKKLQVGVFGIHMYNRCDIDHKYFSLYASLVADRLPAFLSQSIRHGDSFVIAREAWLLFARVCAHAKHDPSCKLIVSRWWANGVFDCSKPADDSQVSLFADTVMSRVWKIEMGNVLRFFHGFANAIEFAPPQVMWRENSRRVGDSANEESAARPKTSFHLSKQHLLEIISFIKYASPNFDLKQSPTTKGLGHFSIEAAILFGQAPMIGQAFHACSEAITVLPRLEVFEVKGELLVTALAQKNHPLVTMYRDKLVQQLSKIVV